MTNMGTVKWWQSQGEGGRKKQSITEQGRSPLSRTETGSGEATASLQKICRNRFERTSERAATGEVSEVEGDGVMGRGGGGRRAGSWWVVGSSRRGRH